MHFFFDYAFLTILLKTVFSDTEVRGFCLWYRNELNFAFYRCYCLTIHRMNSKEPYQIAELQQVWHF